MDNKFRNKYRIPSARLQSWDYGSNGYYFITICTADRECFFGKIADGEMQRNDLGEIAHRRWEEIPAHFPFIELGNFVVMPNHVHGILIINKPTDGGAMAVGTNGGETTAIETNGGNATDGETITVETPKLGVSTLGTTTAASDKWKPATIGVIINQFKRKVTIDCRGICPDFAWQSRFHDHIIRNATSFENIQNYISNNPTLWQNDKFNTK